MKKNCIISVLLLFGLQTFAQLTITPGAQWVNTGNVIVTIQDMDLVNNGNFTAGNSTVRFNGVANSGIGGNATTNFYDMHIVKTAGMQVTLLGNISLDHQLYFISGLLDLNQKNFTLASTALLMGENETNRIIGPNGGEVIITLNLNQPGFINPGMLGCIITSSANMGAVTIRRGHKPQTGAGISGSIKRYYSIGPTNNTNLNATLRLKYFDAELNGQNENTMIMFKSIDNGVNWVNQSINSRDINANWVEKTNINDFSRWTLSGPAQGGLPVLGLQFFAKRISPSQVKLNWQTIQEINNAGFFIERKKQTDNDFSSVSFTDTKAINGNSSSPLDYTKLDDNSYSGYTYYRLKQTDIDGHFTYSVIRLVNGDVQKEVVLKVWPVPAVGDFNVMVQGIDKDGSIQVFDAIGKLLQTITVKDNISEKINRLPGGTYFIRLAGDKNISQKVVVQ
ncbi:MAG TPA: T9SS type A sorting domain-containing protein [Chitinophagaceae bacterium]|nr:T9SS type A sorting domain-containing protein [Chitinophagaceae bacterium]